MTRERTGTATGGMIYVEHGRVVAEGVAFHGVGIEVAQGVDVQFVECRFTRNEYPLSRFQRFRDALLRWLGSARGEVVTDA